MSGDISFNHSKDEIRVFSNLIIQGIAVILIKCIKPAKESAEEELILIIRDKKKFPVKI